MHKHRFILGTLSLLLFLGCGNLELATINSQPSNNTISYTSNPRSIENSTLNISEAKISEADEPLNIILLIGDGMGLSQVSASHYYGTGPSNFDRFNTIGLIKTSASSDLVTDSAASATAYSAGVQTYNGAIGVTKDSIAAKTIVEYAIEKGLSTGLIATSSLMHATPGSFYAHSKSRQFYEEIATFMPDSGVDFFAGGGQLFCAPRTDGRNIYDELKAKNYEVTLDSLPSVISNKKQAIILAPDGMPRMLDGRGDFLARATKLALKKLATNKKGFFLMVEGSQIDWGGHSNEAPYLITELIDFEKTIGVALDFAKSNKNTLVIVTADHETGGFTLSAEDGNYNVIEPRFSTKSHSATMVPVFSKGPGEKNFAGIYQNTSLFKKMMQALKLK
ncbi:alkaline phosphatase [Patiriisocius marinistellae]|uniref:Alkaline phosphatase n=1 Tax=Patiriisocius marinistellae TaxID=2494560 RepID=A0A5J4FZH4_9FLAO|nr:alkaline phosphatase [Patiriisocius marinistellae]GEQ85589.1 alkaline phosphatase [Patiriisocius marinistellae]